MRIAHVGPSFYFVTAGAWSADWAWGAPLIVLTVVIHVLGLGIAYHRAVTTFGRNIDRRHPAVFFAMVLSTMTLLATVLHAAEAGAWAACYRFLGTQPDFKTAMLYSLGAMTTYGHSDLHLEARWQLMGAIEALSGWLLFGLTTAFLFGTIEKCYQIASPNALSQYHTGGKTDG